MGASPGECSEAIRDRVIKARAIQNARLGNHKTNSHLTPRQIRDVLVLDQECQDFMRSVSNRMNLSARVFDRILKVARTIADLAGSEQIVKNHISEAVQYRDRGEG
jgi:magnesium chelatase family protein